MSNKIRKAIIGRKATMRARVYRASTGKYEDQKTLYVRYIGGLVEPLRVLYRFITGKNKLINK